MCIDDLPRCSIISWEREQRIPLCSRFNQGSTRRHFGNCELASSPIHANRDGWLENFRPTLGQWVAGFEGSDSEIVSLADGDGALFIGFSNGTVQRVAKALGIGSSQLRIQPLWAASADAHPLTMALSPETNTLFYAKGSTLSHVRLTCAGLYPTCASIAWDDPMGCEWCAELNSTGRTVSALDGSACETGQRLRGKCPPRIESVSMEKGLYSFFGEKFDSFVGEKPERITACNQTCKLEFSSPTA